ncbi:MAG: cell division protein ZapD [Gammaproteobacteria bacterium]
MTEVAAEGAAATPAGNGEPLVFEQPLNERMRAYLRLDFLYSQGLFHAHSSSQWTSRAAITSLLDIIAIITRSDIRADVLKELERQMAVYTEFQRRPNIDVDRLQALVSNLSRLRTELLTADSSRLQPLRDSPFLAAIRHRSAIPGGTCDFDLPDLSYWLAQPNATREQALSDWLALLRPLCDSIAELLWLTRQSGRVRSEVAANGVFHIAFDRGQPVQLLRVSVPAELGVFPEISGSHYRASVRFVSWQGLNERARQVETDVPFDLICCH